jgi:hypothetical protein
MESSGRVVLVDGAAVGHIGSRVDAEVVRLDGLFHRPGAQGDGRAFEGMDPEERAFAEALALEVFQRALARPEARPDDAAEARRVLASLFEPGERQGNGPDGDAVLRRLVGLRGVVAGGVGTAPQYVAAILSRLARLVRDAELRERAAALVSPEAEVVIGYSLGAIVAHAARPAGVLVTLGSPLGPAELAGLGDGAAPWRRWVNLVDPADLLAADPGPPEWAEQRLRSEWTPGRATRPGDPSGYLTQPLVVGELPGKRR